MPLNPQDCLTKNRPGCIAVYTSLGIKIIFFFNLGGWGAAFLPRTRQWRILPVRLWAKGEPLDKNRLKLRKKTEPVPIVPDMCKQKPNIYCCIRSGRDRLGFLCGDFDSMYRGKSNVFLLEFQEDGPSVCASCEREARGGHEDDEEEDDICGDPLVYATVVAPIQQYRTETEPSRQPSFNSRQPSFNSRQPSENSRQPSEKNSRQPSENSRQPSFRQNSCEAEGSTEVSCFRHS